MSSGGGAGEQRAPYPDATAAQRHDDRSLLQQYRLDPNANELSDGTFGVDEAESRPWSKIALAAGLLVLGTALLIAGLVIFIMGEPNGIALIVIGSLAFIPGFFYTHVAFLAWRGREGYDVSIIPGI